MLNQDLCGFGGGGRILTNNLPVKKYKNRRVHPGKFSRSVIFMEGVGAMCGGKTASWGALSTKNTSDIWFLCLRIKFNENKNMSS